MKLSYKDFNSKTLKELCKVPGIGSKTAKNIVSMRPFRSNDDLFKVRGLGKKILKNLGIEKKKKKRNKWVEIDGIQYPHYSFAFHEITGVMDFFWRIPREYRLYYGKEEESKKLTARIRENMHIEMYQP